MRTIFVITLKGVPIGCFDTKSEADYWVKKMISEGVKSSRFIIHQTTYYYF